MNPLTWRKSSHSDETGGQRVELTRLPEAIAIRDSKAPQAARRLSIAPDQLPLLTIT